MKYNTFMNGFIDICIINYLVLFLNVQAQGEAYGSFKKFTKIYCGRCAQTSKIIVIGGRGLGRSTR